MRIQAQNGNWIEQKCSNCDFGNYEIGNYTGKLYLECQRKAIRSWRYFHEYGHGCFVPSICLLSVFNESGKLFIPGDPGFEEACKTHEPEIH